LISIVIVHWNTPDHLEELLTSLEEAEAIRNHEVIVVDNGSAEGPKEVIQARWPTVVLIQLPQNVGFGVANNVGASLATGDTLLFMNSDTLASLGFIRALKGILSADSAIGCAGPKHLNIDGSLQPSMGAFPTLVDDILELTGADRINSVKAWLAKRSPYWGPHDEHRIVDWVNGACMMIGADAFRSVGGFDERFFAYAEEVDLCRRLQLGGWKIAYCPESVIMHKRGCSLDGEPDVRLELRYWGHLQLYYLHRSRTEYLLLRTLVAFVAMVRVLALGILAAFRSIGGQPSRRLVALIADDDSGKAGSMAWRGWASVVRFAVMGVSKTSPRHPVGPERTASDEEDLRVRTSGVLGSVGRARLDRGN
jgi:GT2 family glycosyltransferase